MWLLPGPLKRRSLDIPSRMLGSYGRDARSASRAGYGSPVRIRPPKPLAGASIAIGVFLLPHESVEGLEGAGRHVERLLDCMVFVTARERHRSGHGTTFAARQPDAGRPIGELTNELPVALGI